MMGEGAKRGGEGEEVEGASLAEAGARELCSDRILDVQAAACLCVALGKGAVRVRVRVRLTRGGSRAKAVIEHGGTKSGVEGAECN